MDVFGTRGRAGDGGAGFADGIEAGVWTGVAVPAGVGLGQL
ncbi:hypothetical protein [Pseudodesulfovibrio sp.]